MGRDMIQQMQCAVAQVVARFVYTKNAFVGAYVDNGKTFNCLKINGLQKTYNITT